MYLHISACAFTFLLSLHTKHICKLICNYLPFYLSSLFTLLFCFLLFLLMIGVIKETTHALVLMLGGVFVRWKIPVAYDFTPSNVNDALLKPIVEQLIQKAESVGLYVYSVTTNMGPVNLAM